MLLIQQNATYGTYPVYIPVGESTLVPTDFDHWVVCGLYRSERDRQYPFSGLSSVGVIRHEYPRVCTKDKQFTHHTGQVKSLPLVASSSSVPEIHIHHRELPGFRCERPCNNYIKKQLGSPIDSKLSLYANRITSRKCCSDGPHYMTDMQSVSPTVQKNGHIDLHDQLLYLCERIESGDLDGENLLVEGQELEEIKGVGRKLASLASFEGCDIIAKFLDTVTLVGEVLSAVGNIVDEMESAGVAASDTDQPGGANDDAADDVHGAETPTKDRIMENVTDDALAAIIRSAFAHRQSLEREYLAGCCEGFAVDPNLPLRMLKRNLKLPDEIRAGMGPETTQTLTKYTELLESPSNTKAKYACSNGEKGESELVDGVTTMEK